MRKKVDSRIRTLVENCVALRQRGLFVIVGDKGRDQVVNLHYMLSKASVKARPTVLWCYKKELYLSSHRKKRVKQIQKLSQRGLLDPEKEDPFSLFVASTSIRYCYYAETQNILGNTYGMAVLQDFEALTPNLLARTVETVEGGGLVILLLANLSSLTQLFTLTMDVHSRLRTESHQNVTGRFNERLVLSLASCPNCILMDDELNVLPTSSLIRSIEPVALGEDGLPLDDPSRASQQELKQLAETLEDTQPAGSLVPKCRTLDQARALITFLDAASEKTLRSTVALTASRGRGKSAALGLSIAGALALGYSNIFVTAPSPENLKTLFQFVFKGLDALGYKEHIDYDLVESTNPAFGKAIVRVNVYRAHRQTVQYILPQHHAKLAQAELLVIDEAAAIPLPTVKSLLGPYLVFLCSTVNGYEGTGRSLSLKLIQQLREQGAKVASAAAGASGAAAEGIPGIAGAMRTFREVTLAEPIRYAPGDSVEAWLHGLLCLDAAQHLPKPPPRLPHPEQCELYYVERDTLFSFHKASERFLQAMVSLFVASHYKNTPNDLLLMADAPAHHMFVLLGPVDETQNVLPDVLAVVQVALEGAISKKAASQNLARGEMPQGDLIPWTVSQQFQDAEFPSLSGARVVRIAVHPEMPRAGYGTRCVELLKAYYQGKLAALEESEEAAGEGDEGEGTSGGDSDGEPENGKPAANGTAAAGRGDAGGNTLLSEQVAPRTGLPPLLVALSDRPPERLHYLGVSYGLTQHLYNFWNKSGFHPLYLRQAPNEVTGEFTCVMVAPLEHPDVSGGTAWLTPLVTDFKHRFISLLAGAFRELPPALALSILQPRLSFSDAEAAAGVEGGLTVNRPDGGPISPYDLKRLQAYANNLVDYHLILDLVPPIAAAYLAGRLPISLSHAQVAILLVLGCQRRSVEEAGEALGGLPPTQVLALFGKALRKLHAGLRASKEAALERTMPKVTPAALGRDSVHGGPLALGSMDAELEEAAAEVREQMRAKYLQAEDLMQYAVAGADEDLAAATGGRAPASGGVVSVKAAKQAVQDAPAGVGSDEEEDVRKGGKKGKGREKMLYAKKQKLKRPAGGKGRGQQPKKAKHG